MHARAAGPQLPACMQHQHVGWPRLPRCAVFRCAALRMTGCLNSSPEWYCCLAGWYRRYYSLFTLVMLVSFECTVVGQRLRNLSDVRSLQAPKQVGAV